MSRDELSHTAIQGTLKGVVSAKEDEHDAPRAPNIGFTTICLSSHFWCYIQESPDELVQNLAGLGEGRKPEINDLDYREPVLILVDDQNVFRLKSRCTTPTD